MRRLLLLVLLLALAGSCADDTTTDTTTPTSAGGDGQTAEGSAATDDVVDLVLLSDSLTHGGWPTTWAGLIEDDLDTTVRVHDLSVDGRADYDTLLQQPDVIEALEGADIVFISPDPDHLRDACPPGASDDGCVARFSTDYRQRWAGWLDDIDRLSEGAMLRSADAWVWLAPSGGRAGLVEFMGDMAAETVAHGGLVADINTALTGGDRSEEPPADTIDATGHLTGAGADDMAELLHGLGYDAAL